MTQWYLTDPPLWPGHLPFQHAEVVNYANAPHPDRHAVVVDAAHHDPATGEDQVIVRFYDDGDRWMVPVSRLTSQGRFDRNTAGPWIYPTLAQGSIVELRSRLDCLAEVLGLWCTDDLSDVQGYSIRPFGQSAAVFARFEDLRLPQ